MEIEKRRRERRSVDLLIEVKDALLDLKVGRIVNMHEEGFMLIGNDQIKENHLYQLVMEFNHIGNNDGSISLGAECLWMKETDSGTQYWAGFHVIDISEQDRNIISNIISVPVN